MLHVYIDESGSFTCFPQAKSSVSCVAALVVSESVHDTLLQEFELLARSWGLGGQEVKGRLLSEHQFDEAIHLVYQTQRAFLRIAAIDMGLHTVAMIKDHKSRQAQLLRAPMAERFSKTLVDQVDGLASQLERSAPQLYVEATLLTELVVSVIQTGTMLFSQLEPPTLDRFSWRVDAKDNQPTDYEDLWKALVLPFVQAATLRSTAIFLKEGDYSYFAPFENPDLSSAPEHCGKRRRTQTRSSALSALTA